MKLGIRKSPTDNALSGNEGGQSNRDAKDKQKKLAFVVVGVFIAGAAFVALKKNGAPPRVAMDETASRERLMGAAARSPGDRETLSGVETLVKNIGATATENEREITEVKGDVNEALGILRQLQEQGNARDNESDELSVLKAEIDALRALVRRNPGPGSTEGFPSSLNRPGPGAGGSAPLRAPGSSRGPKGSLAGRTTASDIRRTQVVLDISSPKRAAQVETLENQANGGLSEASAPSVFDTEHYVPPNAHAPAIVYVGVDAGTGSAAQADPQVAQFMITGTAKHVVEDGVVQETDLTGCLVNGAATGDLSTERVFIRLQKMTCPLEGGRVAVSSVEGHVTQLGKAGVRGNVISREGDLLTKAMIAALAQGVGQGAQSFGGNGNLRIGQNGAVGSDFDLERSGIAALGGGVAAGGETVSQYILDRAKSYDPVVQMPTGVAVELTFINGTLVRPAEKEGEK